MQTQHIKLYTQWSPQYGKKHFKKFLSIYTLTVFIMPYVSLLFRHLKPWCVSAQRDIVTQAKHKASSQINHTAKHTVTLQNTTQLNVLPWARLLFLPSNHHPDIYNNTRDDHTKTKHKNQLYRITLIQLKATLCSCQHPKHNTLQH